MDEQGNQVVPVAVWVQSIGEANQAYSYNGYICHRSADVRASSSDGKLKLDLSTNPLSQELLVKFDHLLTHGFTVVEVPNTWLNEFSRPHTWRDILINQALDRVMKLSEVQGPSVTYNESLADEVLSLLKEQYPYSVSLLDIKHSLRSEPADGELLTALHGLQIESFITSESVPNSNSKNRRLRPTMKVQITKEGKRHVIRADDQEDASHQVIHQYNNFGLAGAMGSHSTGTVNYQQEWSKIEEETNLAALTQQLEAVRTHLLKTASSRSDFQQLGLLADAEAEADNGNGSKAMEILSKVGKGALDCAVEVGSSVVAKVISKAWGLET